MKEFEKLNSSQLNYVRELLRFVLKCKLLEEVRSYTLTNLKETRIKATEDERMFRAEKRNGERIVVHIKDWKVVRMIKTENISIIQRA